MKKNKILGIIVVIAVMVVIIGYFVYQNRVNKGKTITISTEDLGKDLEILKLNLSRFEEKTSIKTKLVVIPSSTKTLNQFQTWLAEQNKSIDIYVVNTIWTPQISEHLIKLNRKLGNEAKAHFPTIIASQTVNNKLVAFPFLIDAPALYYRKDLLGKHNRRIPKTWNELTSTAHFIQIKERNAGNSQFYGYIWQGAAYEELTCDALEWISSYGGGQIIEPDGRVSVNNPKAIAAIERARSWIGTISPVTVLSQKAAETQKIWQKGNAAFIRYGSSAYRLGQISNDSKIKNKFEIAPLPSGGKGSAATLGGWNFAVAKYSENQRNAIKLIRYLTSKETQKLNAIKSTRLPTITDLYDDADLLEVFPFLGIWKKIILKTVPRPAAITKVKYAKVSQEFWTAINNSLASRGSVNANLAALEKKLNQLKGSEW